MSLLKRIRNAAPLLHSINKLTTAAQLLSIHQAASAQSIGGLSRAQTTLQTLRDNLDVILPIAIKGAVAVMVDTCPSGH